MNRIALLIGIRVCVLIVISSLPIPSVFGREPLEVKGDRLGMSLQDFKQKYHRDVRGDAPAPFCSDGRGSKAGVALFLKPWHAEAGVVGCSSYYPYEMTRGEGPTLAGQKTELLVYHFVDGALFRVTVLFPRKGYESVRDAFVTKYGAPDRSKTDELQNSFGAKFSSENLAWFDTTGDLNLQERVGNVDRSMLVLSDPSLEKLVESRKPKTATDDI